MATLSIHSHSQLQLIHPTTSLPTFEVATIRLNDSSVPFMASAIGSQRTVRVAGNLRALIAQAYNVDLPQRIISGFEKVDNPIYRVEATIPEETFSRMQKETSAVSRQEAQLMLQALLRDRFALRVHFGEKELPVYEIEETAGGAKLPSPNSPPISSSGGWAASPEGLIRVRNMTLTSFLLAPMFQLNDRVIVNKTKYIGYYNFTFSWKRPPHNAFQVHDDPFLALAEGNPAATTALKEQLGIQLKPAKAPVEVLYLDHVEAPTPN